MFSLVRRAACGPGGCWYTPVWRGLDNP